MKYKFTKDFKKGDTVELEPNSTKVRCVGDKEEHLKTLAVNFPDFLEEVKESEYRYCDTPRRKKYASPKSVLTTMYLAQKHRCLKRNRPLPSYTLQQLHDRFLEDEKYLTLYAEWLESGFQKWLKPSIDRIDASKPYTMDNVQMITWAENEFKGRRENRSRMGKVYQLKNGKIICVFESQAQAAKALNVFQQSISNVLRGKFRQFHGYKFVYEKDLPGELKIVLGVE